MPAQVLPTWRGNVAGTNVVNTLFILGLVAAIRPLSITTRVLRIDLPAMLIATTALLLFGLDGVITRRDGAILVAAAVVYSLVIVFTARSEDPGAVDQYDDEDELPAAPAAEGSKVRATVVAVLSLVAGLAVIVVGAELLVNGAVDAARALGVSDALIGLTVVAIGTSAPEMATALVATVRGERDIAVGNLFGSSVFNILAILGVTAIVAPDGLPVPNEVLRFDLPVLVAVSLLCVPVFLTGRRVSRAEGVAFVALYLAYLATVLVTRT